MAILPLGHDYNLASPGMLGAFYYGGTVVLAPGTGVDEVFSLVQRERVTVIAAVVPLITTWLNSEALSAYDLSSLSACKTVGPPRAGVTAPPPPATRLHAAGNLWCGRGSRRLTRLGDPDELLLESSGAPVCDEDEIMVVDDAGAIGRRRRRRPCRRGAYTIRGYYNAPDKNADAFLPGGWYRMGDVVRRRGRYVYTEGRRKDMINRGGEKISCEEIESLILGHPSVKSAVLVGMPDPVFGEKACACVVTLPRETLAFADLIAFLRERQIASFKLPERLEFFHERPVSPVGKILKRQLRETIVERLALNPASAMGAFGQERTLG